MENLISMTDFVLEQKALKIMRLVKLQRIEKYANFLKQPKELWMFVPCNNDGNILKEPIPFNCTDLEYSNWCEAKEKCLFEGFERSKQRFSGVEYEVIKNNDTYIYFYDTLKNKWIGVNDYKTLECLRVYNLKLTETAKKMFF